MKVKMIACVVCVLMLLSFVSAHFGGGNHHHGGPNRYHGGYNGHHSGSDGYHGYYHGHHGGNNHGQNDQHGQHQLHHWHRQKLSVNFEAHETKGMTIFMVQQSPDMTFFGIELSINKVPNEIECDVCKNTTTVTYGKFILEDAIVVIKKGDVLYYNVLIGDKTDIKRWHLQKLRVTDSIINKCDCENIVEIADIDVRFEKPIGKPHQHPFVQVNRDKIHGATNLPTEFYEPGDPSGIVLLGCEVDPSTNLCRTDKFEKLTKSNDNLEREIEILEAIVEKIKFCGLRDCTNFVRFEVLRSDTSDMKELTDYARSLFSVNADMQLLFNRIRRVLSESGSPRVVLLDMSSYVDKQKVLYHAQTNNINQISDYDLGPLSHRR